jgi:16S rRNA U516 pseudouridylate synthase RsuA-like enzyme
MIEALGSKVMKLTRIAIGPIRIGPLEVGRYRDLTPEEIATLNTL